jgi:putative transposase
MSNHYLIKPDDALHQTGIRPWALAACSNAGHFWEGRYRNTSFPDHEQQRALNTLRYIHANPKTAGMRKGYFYAYSNYGLRSPHQ